MTTLNVDPKLRKDQIERYDQWMDSECVPLCDALNSLSGIKTFESCCGHGQHPFMIFFNADSIDSLRPLLMEIHDRRGWTVEVQWANGGDAIYFGLFYEHVDVSNCERVFAEANAIAEALR